MTAVLTWMMLTLVAAAMPASAPVTASATASFAFAEPSAQASDSESHEAARPRMSDAEIVTQVRARLDSLTRADAFSGAVLLAHGDRVLLREAYGLASRKAATPNRPDTRFNLGSINKMFTRIAIEQLAAAGKLRLTDTIDRYLPDYPSEKGRKITIEQLLEHRAGTGHMFGEAYQAMDHSRLLTVADWMKVVRDEPLLFEPGARQEYSNTGYVLLGAIVERVSGRSYYDYVREHVYRPASMRATDSYASAANVPNRAIGYTRGLGAHPGAAWQDNSEWLPGRGSPAGGGYSTVDDLRRFADALREGRLGVPAENGLGIAGGAPGVNAMLEMLGDYTVVVLANLDPPAAERVAFDVRGWLRLAGVEPEGERREHEVGGGGRHEVRHGGPEAGGPASEAHAGGPTRRIVHGGMGDGPLDKPRSIRLPLTPVDVPMMRSGHMPVVEAMVNGQGPFRFAIDTGGAGSARIDSALAAKLGLAKVGEVMAGDPSGLHQRAMGLVAVDSISVGGAHFEGLTAAVRDYNEPRGPDDRIDGILGFGLFADCLFTLDYPGSRVRIEAGSLPAANGRDVLAYRADHAIPIVSLTVGGHSVPAAIDAGSMGGFSLPDSFATKLSLASEPRVIGRARTVSNTFEIKGADLRGEILLGGFRFENPAVTFHPILPNANVGARVLRDFRITFDQRAKVMRLERTGPTAESAK